MNSTYNNVFAFLISIHNIWGFCQHIKQQVLFWLHIHTGNKDKKKKNQHQLCSLSAPNICGLCKFFIFFIFYWIIDAVMIGFYYPSVQYPTSILIHFPSCFKVWWNFTFIVKINYAIMVIQVMINYKYSEYNIVISVLYYLQKKTNSIFSIEFIGNILET